MGGLKSAISNVLHGTENAASSALRNTENAAKTLTSKRDYVSDKNRNTFGNTYTRYGGLISVLKKRATPETEDQATRQLKAKGKNLRDLRN